MKKTIKLNTKFIKSHINAKKLIQFSVTYDKCKRINLEFLNFLKNLPFVCNFFLSKIQAKQMAINVVDRGSGKLNDLKKVHEILNTLEQSKTKKKMKGLCELYDDNLNLVKPY